MGFKTFKLFSEIRREALDKLSGSGLKSLQGSNAAKDSILEEIK